MVWSWSNISNAKNVTITLSYSFRHKRKELRYCSWPFLDIKALNKHYAQPSWKDIKSYESNTIVKFNFGNENCFSLGFQSVPSVNIPPGNPGVNLQNLANPSYPRKFFCQMPSPQTSLGTFYFNKFDTFPPHSRLNH